MAEFTQNYNLKKPAEEDFYNVKDFNDNADIIDQALKAHDDAINEHLDDGTQHAKTARFVIGTSTAGWTAKDCDYLCDGTNDQEEIIQALNALPATGGEVVILDGTYNITASINIPKDNVSIRGNGNATTLKRMYDSTGTNSGPTARGLITLNEKSGCKIQGLQIDGNKATYTASYNYGIYLYSSSDNAVTSNICNNNSSSIYLSSSSNNTVTNNTCNNNSNYGIRLYSSSNNNTITDNTCNNNSYGIYLSSSSNNNVVTGNTCNNNSNNYGIYLSSSSNNTVTSNICNDNNSDGIRLDLSSNNAVTGNTCNNNSNYGIRLYSSSNNNTVTGNTCNDNNSSGIRLSSSSNNTITGNICIRGTGQTSDYASDQYTIQLQGTDNNYNLISSNNCMGKAPVIEGGTGNTVFNNKWDASDDIDSAKQYTDQKVGEVAQAINEHLDDGTQHAKTARFVIGTSTAGWTAKDCDYLCDGTNDQEEINNAITALPASGGEIVILDGTYNITATINVNKNNVSIRGNGNATVLKRMWDSSSPEGVITLTSAKGCRVQNLQINGNKANYSSVNNNGIYLYLSSDNTVTGNTCNDNNSSGIYLDSSNDNTITENTCNNNNSYGIRLDSSGNNTVTDNTCNNNNNYGIHLYSSSKNTVTDNTCNNSNYGIYLYLSSNNTITSNACNNNGYGIYLHHLSDNNTITGNTCNSNNYGIYLYSSSNNTITGNTYNSNSYGIYLSSSSNNNTITGNTCNDNGYGIYLSSSSNNTVTGNTCNDNNSSGIYLSSSSDNTVTGNICNSNNYGIYLDLSSNNNAVTDNTCNNNSDGIFLSSSSDNAVTGNTCNNNSDGIRLSSSSNNTITGNICNNNSYGYGIYLYSSSNNAITGNTCNNNSSGIYLYSSSNNTITGNTCIRGTGQTSDYASDQYTIQLQGTDNNYNLISLNNCMGKAVVVDGGTGNSVWGNKFDATNDLS